MGSFGRKLRRRYPSWFRYVVRDPHDTPTLDFLARIHPSSDGTRDAPMDAESSRFFWKIAIGVIVVGAVLVALAVAGR